MIDYLAQRQAAGLTTDCDAPAYALRTKVIVRPYQQASTQWNIESTVATDQQIINNVAAAYANTPAGQIQQIADAAQYAEMAADAYDDATSDSELWQAPPGWKVISVYGIKVPDTAGLSATVFQSLSSNQIVVAFRGTQGSPNLNNLDWNTDVQLATGVSVNAIPEMQQALNFALSEFNAYKGDVIFVGHSLGGAMAQYAAIKTGATAYAFDPAPLAESISNLPIPIEIPTYNNIHNFRGPADPVTGLSSWEGTVGPAPLVVKNAPTESANLLFVGYEQVFPSFEYNHDAANLAAAMMQVKLDNPEL